MRPPKRGIITRKSASASPALAFGDGDLVLLEARGHPGKIARAVFPGHLEAGSTEFYAAGIRPALQ